MKHKHYDLILAWANGAEIEIKSIANPKWVKCLNPTWSDYANQGYEYRIYEPPEIMCSITHADYTTRNYPQPIQSIDDAIKLMPDVASELFYVDIKSVYMCGWISRQDNPSFEHDLTMYIRRGILHKTRKNAIQHTYALLNLENL